VIQPKAGRLINKSNFTQLAVALGGLPVYGCLAGSPAERAGMRSGDILMSVDGRRTPSWDAYLAARAESGTSIRLRLFRDGHELELDVPLTSDGTLRQDSLIATLGLLGATGHGGEEPN